MNATQLVQLAHQQTSGDRIANPTEAEIWLANLVLSMAPGVSTGFMRAIPPKVRPMDIKGDKPIEDPTVKDGAP